MRDMYNPSASVVLLAQSAVPVLLTGTTVETLMAEILIPGGVMGPHGSLEIWTIWSCTNNANSKTPRLRWSGPAGGEMFNTVLASVSSLNLMSSLTNRGSESSQVQGHRALTSFASSSGGLFTWTVDTRVDQTIALSGELANAGDSLTLERYSIKLARFLPPGR